MVRAAEQGAEPTKPRQSDKLNRQRGGRAGCCARTATKPRRRLLHCACTAAGVKPAKLPGYRTSSSVTVPTNPATPTYHSDNHEPEQGR